MSRPSIYELAGGEDDIGERSVRCFVEAADDASLTIPRWSWDGPAV